LLALVPWTSSPRWAESLDLSNFFSPVTLFCQSSTSCHQLRFRVRRAFNRIASQRHAAPRIASSPQQRLQLQYRRPLQPSDCLPVRLRARRNSRPICARLVPGWTRTRIVSSPLAPLAWHLVTARQCLLATESHPHLTRLPRSRLSSTPSRRLPTRFPCYEPRAACPRPSRMGHDRTIFVATRPDGTSHPTN
jgi:hypothetical protein